MTRLAPAVLALLAALAAPYTHGEDDPYAPYRSAMKGDSVIFTITARCDSARLRQAEAALQPGARTVVWYEYTMLFNFRDGMLAGSSITGMDFPAGVQECILRSFIGTARFPAPADGTVPFEVAFPVFVAAKP